MAVLQNIRVKFGVVISIIIALALLSFIIDPTTLESALSSMSSKYDVGQINGKSVSYTDFQSEIEQFSTISEIMTGSSVKNDQQQEQIRNSAWQNLVDKYLFVKNAREAGINVGKEEMLALTSGDMVSPVLAQNYNFVDKNGQYDPNALVEFVNEVDADQTGRLKTYWNYLQNTIHNQQYYAKYGSLFTNGDTQNPLMLQRAIADNNTTTDAEFVMVPYPFVTDSTVVVSGAEIKKFYNDHKKFFKQAASRDAEYVVFEVKPSDEDIAAANEAMSELYEEFATTDNVKTFLTKNSDRAYSDTWYKEGGLSTVSKVVSDFVDGAKAGEVSQILADGNNFYGVRILGVAPKSESITFRALSAQTATAVTDSLVTALRLNEPVTMTRANTFAGLESLFDEPVGRPTLLKTLNYGQILVEVVTKSDPVQMKQVAIFEKDALASKETFNRYYAQANKFATIANGSYENYKAAVDTLGVYSHPVNKIMENTASYGAIDNAREVTRWIFDNKPGKVSNIITVNNNYFFVATVKGVHEEGFATLEEVAPNIRTELYGRKLGEKQAAEIAEKIQGLDDMQAIAEALGTTVSTQADITFASMRGQGLDPAFIGAVSAAPEGKVCGPVAGSIGTYVFKVTGRDTGAFYTEDDARNTQLQKSQYMTQMILPVMMDLADVKDNRARFY
jgi:peptidyl-prolyl cis-trans isomerase D